MRRMLFDGSVLPARSLLGTSALALLTWVAAPSPAAAEDAGDAALTPAIIYVSNAGGGITEVNTENNSVIATAPFPNNANGVVVTPDGRRIYATNRDVPEVTVFDARTNVPLTVIPVGNGTQDNLGVAVSPDGDLVYVANQVSGTVTVIDTETNRVIQTIPTGLEPIWITFSADGSWAYVSNQVSGTVSVIATTSGAVIATITGFSCPFQSKATMDDTKLLVSSQCDGTLKVVNLATNMVVNSILAGAIPRGIALSPDGTLAYVANFGANTVQVIDVDAQRNLNTPITVGSQPWGIAMTPGGKAYVANFGDGTISVIDSATNMVTATLRTRVFPEDVTVSTTAGPRVLNYKFQSIAPSGSPYSLVRSLNNRGDAVGDFLDASFGFHGFLRTSAGVLTTIDPPGSTATSAFAVNDFGVIVGAFIDASGILHGFQRSPSGTYTTIDFPGVPDSQLTGINDFGEIAGAYDLGNRASTRCPGPTCHAFSFLLRSGQFTPFADPVADPSLTFAFSINNRGQIAGLFRDSVGNIKGFVRNPADGSFRTVQFPTAEAFSYLEQINDLDVAAGEYGISSVGHGFLAYSTHFLSFDFPDSVATGLRAVNDLGKVGGYFIAVPGGPILAFIASPREE
jgi:YVTN family beta-propeller protein